MARHKLISLHALLTLSPRRCMAYATAVRLASGFKSFLRVAPLMHGCQASGLPLFASGGGSLLPALLTFSVRLM